MDNPLNIAIIGGGAAGFFTAANIPDGHFITIFEQSGTCLKKVKISGGGRCNVTHHEFDIKNFTKNYPRGERELISPFHKFSSSDTLEWFRERGVSIKAEDDGRMFPTTNKSQTIIDCFLNEAKKKKAMIIYRKIDSIEKKDQKFLLTTDTGDEYSFDRILLATGSSLKGHELAKSLGHHITELAPSLFSFKINHPLLKNEAGTSFKNVQLELHIDGKKFEQSGDLLITHWGLSGPAILKLSAWAAREFKRARNKGIVKINFNLEPLNQYKKAHGKNQIKNRKPDSISKKFWQHLLKYTLVDADKNWADITKAECEALDQALTSLELPIDGQNRFKEEFVECGGIDLKEVNFKTMESKLVPGLFFAGEILDIDGVTGGFNFQNAWSGGYIVANNITL